MEYAPGLESVVALAALAALELDPPEPGEYAEAGGMEDRPGGLDAAFA